MITGTSRLSAATTHPRPPHESGRASKPTRRVWVIPSGSVYYRTSTSLEVPHKTKSTTTTANSKTKLKTCHKAKNVVEHKRLPYTHYSTTVQCTVPLVRLHTALLYITRIKCSLTSHCSQEVRIAQYVARETK